MPTLFPDKKRKANYAKKVIRMLGTSLIAYWPLDSTKALAGDDLTFTNVVSDPAGIGDGRAAAQAGASSYIRSYTSALDAAMNKTLFTVMCWIKVPAAMWTDATLRYAVRFGNNGSNYIGIGRATANYYLRAQYYAGGTLKYQDFIANAPGYTGWVHLAFVVNKSLDKLRLFVNGTELTANPPTGLGTWAGALVTTQTGILSANGGAVVSGWLNGSVAHVMVLNREATALEVARVAAGMKTPRGILYVGDSKTQADWQFMLHDQLNIAPYCQYASLPLKVGVAGITAAGMRARVDSDISAWTFTPEEILVNIGTNDVGPGSINSGWQDDMQYIIDALHRAAPAANIRLAKVWKRGATGGMVQQSALVDALYAANPFLKTGINEIFLENGDDGVTYTSDGIHPNTAGQLLVANAWRVAIKGA